MICSKTNDKQRFHDEYPSNLIPSQEKVLSSNQQRLTEHQLNDQRQERLKEIHMWSIIHQTLISFAFLSLLCLAAYSNRNSHSFEQVHHLRRYFIHSRNQHFNFLQVRTIDEYWMWLKQIFTPKIRAQQWYNGDPPQYLSGFIDDKNQRLIGWPTMRQIRIRTRLCSMQKIETICQDDYDSSNEEQRSFEPGWINDTHRSNHTSIERSFIYRSNDELDSYWYIGDHGSYSGNGYVYEFRGRLQDIKNNLSELHHHQWIDDRTRAVIIQINFYNPNIHLLTSVVILVEFLSTGGVHPHIRIEPIPFYDLTSIPQLIYWIIYFIFIFY